MYIHLHIEREILVSFCACIDDYIYTHTYIYIYICINVKECKINICTILCKSVHRIARPKEWLGFTYSDGFQTVPEE